MRSGEFNTGKSVGLDFGTTNSAIAAAADSQAVLASYETVGGPTTTFPSILYFERIRLGSSSRVRSSAGPAAIERYLEAEEKGRFIQSLKAYLADRRFDGTTIFSKRYVLEEMIALIIGHLLEDAARTLGPVPARAVVGRPVHFSVGETDVDDEFALARMLTAVKACGFKDVVFEYEPVAAAYSYERTLEKDELILIGDFGGGTSDFSILHVGPTVRKRGRTRKDILGTDGVALAGDAFDKQIIRNLVAPRLGKGSEYLSPPDKFLPMPSWPYDRLERWHHVSFMNNRRDLEQLERLRRQASTPERVEALIHLIKGELGYQLHQSVRKTKFELSRQDATEFVFQCAPVSISKTVTRHDFEGWIHEELEAFAACVDRLLAATGVSPAEIDHVFLTGGSSFVPAVRQIFIDRFGLNKITGGQELTSVATGLALRAAEHWPQAEFA
ncbi:MAG TPA: Hsp70 family protein [Vicinamibacterales bacterium]|nr:Hsp70 family protein [Vicinamibacterales bacterium]